MMRVASRITSSSTREALDTNTSYRGSSVPQENLNYIFHNSLQRTLSDFRDHHKACAIRRRGASAIEAQKESQRTEFLSKKYMETVRQEHNTTSVSIGLVSSHSSTYSSTATQSSIPMSSNPAAVTEEVKDLSIMLAPATEKNHLTGNCSVSPMTDTPTCNQKPSPIDGNSKNKKDISIKTENTSKDDTNSCSQTSTKISSSGVNITRTNSAGKVRSRLRQSSKDYIQRSLSFSHSTPLSSDNDSENDLTFTVDEAYRLGTPLKPLEEETTISSSTPLKITPPPSSTNHTHSQSSTSRSTSSTPSSTVATPTCSNNSLPLDNSSLLMELDAFSKVMNQVEQNEKAKERRASCTNSSPFIVQQKHETPPNSHLISPPPYSVNNGGVYHTNSQQSHVISAGHYTSPQIHFDSRDSYRPSFDHTNIRTNNVRPNMVNIHGNSIHSNQDTRYHQVGGDTNQSPHHQLQHSSTHGQIGALLQSPTCPQSTSYDTLNHTYQHTLTSPVLHSPYPLWDSQGMGGVCMSHQPRIGQKRNSVSSMYMPQTKIAHSTISHMPDVTRLSSQPLSNFQTHPVVGRPMGAPHISSYPNDTSYSHMS